MHQARGPLTRSRWIVGVLVWMALLIGVAARESVARAEKPVDRAFRLSNLAGHVREWPELTVAARDEARRRLDGGSWERLAAAAAAAFAPERLLASIEGGLSRDAPAERVAEIVAFYEGDLGLRLQDGRSRARERSLLRAWPRRLSNLVAEGLPAARRRALSRLDLALGISNARLRVATAVAQALARGSASLACAPPSRRAALAARAGLQVQRLQKPVRSIVRIELDLRTQDLSRAELGRYARFAERGAGRWLVAVVLDELEQALSQAETGLLAELEPWIAQDCPAPLAATRREERIGPRAAASWRTFTPAR